MTKNNRGKDSPDSHDFAGLVLKNKNKRDNSTYVADFLYWKGRKLQRLRTPSRLLILKRLSTLSRILILRSSLMNSIIISLNRSI